MDREERIALIGMGCILPGKIRGGTEFWSALCQGHDGVQELVQQRWNHDLLYHPAGSKVDKVSARHAGLVDWPVDAFDAQAFSLSPREAACMDPQQRLLLELAWDAFEDAGILPSSLAGSLTGVFLGASAGGYGVWQSGKMIDAYTPTGQATSVAANRISFCFDLRGPSLALDTACSASLVAVHLACQSLRAGECDLALVGGAQLLLDPQEFYGFSQMGVLSDRGRCRVWDAGADGFVRAEGGALVLLKRESQLGPRDRVYSWILGSAVNQDGRTPGISQPNPKAQTDLLASLYSRLGVDADSLAYVELHGTGTPVGDPLEARALHLALGRYRAQPLPVGSVKTNLGHLEIAAGIVGLVKAALVLHHRQLVPHLHFEEANPDIPLEDWGLRIPTRCESLATNLETPLAGVSSFGFGGTNAHAVLQAESTSAQPKSAPGGPQLLVLSSHQDESLRALERVWAEKLLDPDWHHGLNWLELCHLAARCRQVLPRRRAVLAHSREEAVAQLQQARAVASNLPWSPPVFVFCGQGSQWPGMVGPLRSQPRVAATLERCRDWLSKRSDWCLLEELSGLEEGRLQRAERIMPCLFALQAGLVDLWRSWGVVPAAVVGHSAGEHAAAYAAGALTLEEGLSSAYLRGLCLDQQPPLGGMLATGLTRKQLDARLLGRPCFLAAENAPQSMTVSGSEQALQELAQELEEEGIFWRRLQTRYAFHSPLCQPASESLGRALEGTRGRSSQIPMASSVTGFFVSGEELDARYWANNVLQPVLFGQALQTLLKAGHRNFLEIGPHPVLANYVVEAAGNLEVSTLPSLRRGDPDGRTLLTSLGQAFERGAEIDWSGVYPGDRPVVSLPHRTYVRSRTWLENGEAHQRFRGPSPIALLGTRQCGPQPQWECEVHPLQWPWLQDHRLQAHVLMPATGFLHIFLSAAQQMGRPLALENIVFSKACFLDRARKIRTYLEEGSSQLFVSSAPILEAAWEEHSSGCLWKPWDQKLEAFPQHLCRPEFEVPNFLTRGATQSQFGPCFQGLAQVWESQPVLLARVQAPVALVPELEEYPFHPALLDICLQTSAASSDFRDARRVYLPARLKRVHARSKPGPQLWVLARKAGYLQGQRLTDLVIYNHHFEPIAWLEGLLCLPIDGGASDRAELSSLLWRSHWKNQTRSGQKLEDGVLASLPEPSSIVPNLPNPEPRPARQARLANLSEAAISGLYEVFEGQGWHDPEELPGPAEMRPLWHKCWQLMREHPRPTRTSGLLDPDDAWTHFLLHCLKTLPEVLSGRLSGATAINPDGLGTLLQGIYRSEYDTHFLRVRELLRHWLQHFPRQRPLRVLEVGAGTGSLTAQVLPMLENFALDYYFTDLSPQFLNLARREFQHSAFEFALLDLDKNPLAQGFSEASFDLILGGQVLHATRSVGQSLEHIAQLLADDGLLVLIEGTACGPFQHLTFGLTPGWWNHDDSELRVDGPMLSEVAWLEQLNGHHFTGSVVSATIDQGNFNSLILARRVRRHGALDPSSVGCPPWEIVMDARGRLEALQTRQLHSAQPVAGILYARALDLEPGQDPTDLLWEFVQLVRKTMENPGDVPLSLVVLTQGAVPAGDSGRVAFPSQSAFWGLARCCYSELTTLQIRCIDLDPDWPDSWVQFLELELDHLAGFEDEVALRGDQRFVHQIRQWSDASRWSSQTSEAEFRLVQESPGLLQSLRLHSAPSQDQVAQELKEGQMLVRVEAAGLNFSDVMKGLGIYPLRDGLRASSDRLGGECAGRIVALGPGVEGFSVGQRVLALAPGSFESLAVVEATLALPLPDHLGWEEAATLPIAFLTAHYALAHQARLQAGESVLIHSATGGVGQAALQIARQLGATVLATAGTPEKRESLRRQGVEHVFDSRSLRFIPEVLEATEGQGVHVVLNSLSGELLLQGLEVLTEGGRFVEIGKSDIYRDSKLPLGFFRKSLSFMAVDLEQLRLNRPALLAEMLQQLAPHFASGHYRPLPWQAIRFDEADQAYRCMARAQHQGKLILVPGSAPRRLALTRAQPFQFCPTRSYLLVGGLRGLGLEVAQDWVDQGVRQLILLGRSAAAPEVEARIAAWRARGVTVRIEVMDVTDEVALAELLSELRAGPHPLGGVLQAALVMQDSTLEQMHKEGLAAVLAPKVKGSWNLHLLTLPDSLEFFVLLSSFAALRGSSGQSAYASACSFQDGLALYRKTLGLAGLAVSLGHVGEVGWVARHEDVQQSLRRKGSMPMSVEEVTAGLRFFLQQEVAHAGLGRIDFNKSFGENAFRVPGRFRHLRDTGLSTGQESRILSLRQELLQSSPEQAFELLRGALVGLIRRSLHLAPATHLEADRSLADYGLDSLVSVELRNWFSLHLEVHLPALELLQGPSLNQLTQTLLDQVVAAPDVPLQVPREVCQPGEEQVDPAQLLSHLDELSDEEVEAWLQRLSPP